MPQLIGCTAVLAGTFAALIMIAGSHDSRAITAMLLVAAVLLSVPCALRPRQRRPQIPLGSALDNRGMLCPST